MKAWGSPWGAAARAWISLGVVATGFAAAMRTGGSPWLWLGAAGACLFVGLMLRGIGARAMLLGSLGCVAGAWWVIRIGAPERDAAASVPVGISTIGGVVASEPRVIGTSGTFGPATVQAFDVRVEWIEGTPVVWRAGDLVRVWSAGRVEVGAGERVRCRATIEPVEGPRNPGERDARVRAAQDRLIGHAHTSVSLIDRLGAAPGPAAAMLRASAWLRARADTALGDDRSRGAALVRSLILGEDDGPSGDLAPAREAFTRVGLSHVLAISGFHLVVLVWSVVVVLRLFGDRGAVEPLTVGALVVLYLLIVPAEAPVVRAGIMALAFLGADACGRRHDRLAVLGWVACGLLFWRPADAFSLGFQLSAGLTGTLLLMGGAGERSDLGAAAARDDDDARSDGVVVDHRERSLAGLRVAPVLGGGAAPDRVAHGERECAGDPGDARGRAPVRGADVDRVRGASRGHDLVPDRGRARAADQRAGRLDHRGRAVVR
jgi:hypothetical protein